MADCRSDKINCFVCELNCDPKDSIICDNCQSWIHHKCENITQSDISQSSNVSYTCRGCSDLLTLDLAIPVDESREITAEVATTSSLKTKTKTSIHLNQKSIGVETDINNSDFDKLKTLTELESALKAKERDLKNRESIVKKKEIELNELSLKLSNSQAYILKLEKKILDLEKIRDIGNTSTKLNEETVCGSVPKYVDIQNFTDMEKRIEMLELKVRTFETVSEILGRDRNIVINNNITDKCCGNNKHSGNSEYSSSKLEQSNTQNYDSVNTCVKQQEPSNTSKSSAIGSMSDLSTNTCSNSNSEHFLTSGKRSNKPPWNHKPRYRPRRNRGPKQHSTSPVPQQPVFVPPFPIHLNHSPLYPGAQLSQHSMSRTSIPTMCIYQPYLNR